MLDAYAPWWEVKLNKEPMPGSKFLKKSITCNGKTTGKWMKIYLIGICKWKFFNFTAKQRFSKSGALLFFLLVLKTNGMSEVMYVSKEAFEKMKQELHHMKSVERPAASRAIAEAREKGDLKENAEYDAAKEAQGILEAKMKLLETQVASARIVDPNEIDLGKVSVMAKVTITNMASKKTVTYQIVGEKEADLKTGKISVGSPIGKGLLGKARGEIAEIQAPNGTLKFKVEDIGI